MTPSEADVGNLSPSPQSLRCWVALHTGQGAHPGVARALFERVHSNKTVRHYKTGDLRFTVPKRGVRVSAELSTYDALG